MHVFLNDIGHNINLACLKMSNGRTVSLDSTVGSGLVRNSLSEVIENGLETDESVTRAQQVINRLQINEQPTVFNLNSAHNQQTQFSTESPSSLDVETNLVRTISQDEIEPDADTVPSATVSIAGCSNSFSIYLSPFVSLTPLAQFPPLIVYSWGRSDLGCLFRSDLGPFEPSVPVQFSRNHKIRVISSNVYHTAAVTTTGEVYLCGGRLSLKQNKLSLSYSHLFSYPFLFLSLSRAFLFSLSLSHTRTCILTYIFMSSQTILTDRCPMKQSL